MHKQAEAVVVPELGTGATLMVGSDRYPYTVVEIRQDGSCIIQEDSATRTDGNGQSEVQEWEYKPNPLGAKMHARYHRSKYAWNAGWKVNGMRLSMGSRRKYLDPSF